MAGPERKPRKDRIAGERPRVEEDPLSGVVASPTAVVGGEADLLFPNLDLEGRFDRSIEWAMNSDGAIGLDANPTRRCWVAAAMAVHLPPLLRHLRAHQPDHAAPGPRRDQRPTGLHQTR